MKRVVFAFSLVVASFAVAEMATVVATPDHVDCRYASGETATVSLAVNGTNGLPLASGCVKVAVDNFGQHELLPSRVVDVAQENPVTISVRRDSPGFVRITLTPADPKALTIKGNDYWSGPFPEYTYGLGYDVDKIVSGTPDVADFDAFWSEAVKRMDATVPVDARIEPRPSANPAFSVFRVSVATAQGRRAWGWITEPSDAAKGPYPMHVEVAGAGIGFTGPHPGEAGRIVCLLNVHSYAQVEGRGAAADAERKRAYAAQEAAYGAANGVSRYCQGGIHKSREDYFYYATILGLNRLVDWLATRPTCDRSRITYGGTSQGGGMGLALTYLNRHICRSVIVVPALTDLLGFKAEPGRKSGWPELIEAQKPENRVAAEKNAPYFCGVNFARRIRKPIRFIVGYGDLSCTPNGVYAAYNACPSPDKDILAGVGMSHRAFDDFYDYVNAWERDFSPAPSSADGRYRFLAFNIWGDYFGNPVHERDLDEATVIRRWNPDFIGMQEVTGSFWKSRLFTELSSEYGVVGRGLGCVEPFKDACDPVLYRKYRFDLVDSGAKWFCPELDGSKGLVWAVLKDKATGAKLAIFASHFWWRYDGPGDDWLRLNNAQLLRETMFSVAARYDAAIIGGGDLNSAMEHQAMKYLVSHGLADAQQTAAVAPRRFPSEHGDPVRTPAGPYRGVPAARGMNRVKPLFMWLDHVFYDPTRIAVDRFDLDISPLACKVSDHHPIVADFRLKPKHEVQLK